MGDVINRVRHIPRGMRRELLEEWVFSGTERKIAAEKLLDEDVTYEELAGKYGYSVKRVQDIVRKAVQAIEGRF